MQQLRRNIGTARRRTVSPGIDTASRRTVYTPQPPDRVAPPPTSTPPDAPHGVQAAAAATIAPSPSTLAAYRHRIAPDAREGPYTRTAEVFTTEGETAQGFYYFSREENLNRLAYSLLALALVRRPRRTSSAPVQGVVDAYSFKGEIIYFFPSTPLKGVGK